MKLTRNLKIFIGINVVSTIMYAWFLVNNVGVKEVSNEPATFEVSFLGPLIYGLFWFVSTSLLLKYDNVRGTRKNLGLQYHASMTVVVVLAMMIAFALDSAFREFWIVFPLAALLVSLSVHWFFTRKTIKGIEPKKVFK